VRIGLLGPLEVADDAGMAVRLPGKRLRVLLAALVLSADTPMAGDTLAEFVWDAAPPSGYATTLRSHLMRLRRALPDVRIETLDTGYVLSTERLSLDVAEFGALCLRAGGSLQAGKWEQASEAAARALSLWRGAPLLDLPSQTLRDQAVPKLEQLRVQVLEDHAEAAMALGRHRQLVAPLRERVMEYPLRERFHAQLMLALVRGGRRAEALEAYQAARRVFIEQLGIEPGAQLRRLQERILAGEEADHAAPAHSEQQSPARAAKAPRPRQLPAAPGHFTGRDAELEWLTGLVPQADTQAAMGTVLISAINGMAGIGKTALAIHAAHRVADRFEDGQLFLDLHGYTKGHPPREPGQALEALLRALGVPAGEIPQDLEECAALYRQCLADTRTLIVLDNALDEAQVRPLLPAAPGCLVLVTSRRRLKGLDDARSLPLDVLPPAQAVALLCAVAGKDHIAFDEALLGEIAGLCGYLPLALRIAGALLRHRPAWSVQRLAGLLRDQRRRVVSLSDGERDLGAVLDLSLAGLDAARGLMFRRVGLVPGPDFDAYAAAALLECDPDAATQMLEALVDHNLLIAHAPGRYRMHDLIRAHAAVLAAAEPQLDRAAALDRLLHYYAHTAQSASLPISRYPRSAPEAPAPTHAPPLPSPEAARAWLRTERENLEAAFTHARACTLDGHVLALAAGLAAILRNDGPFTRALILHQRAVETAEHQGQPDACADALTELGNLRTLTGDLSAADEDLRRAVEIYRTTSHHLGEANALDCLGNVQHMIGDSAGALESHSRSLEIYRTLGNRWGEANALANLGDVRTRTCDYSEALAALVVALEIYRALGNRRGEANALTSLGDVRTQTGDYTEALDALISALEIYRVVGNRQGQANALMNMGEVRTLTRAYPEALEDMSTALRLYRELGNRLGEANALAGLGNIAAQARNYPEALDHISQALHIYRALGSRGNEAWALNHYAAAVAAAGDLPRALALYQQALAMTVEVDSPDDHAIALEGISECHRSAGDSHHAIARLRQALEIYERLGMAPDTKRVRARLADMVTTLPDDM
jgi:DNA-binding SARP family transcriptional activator